MPKLILDTEDLSVLGDLKAKRISINALSGVFSKMNQNSNITPKEKYYLKKILVDNINKAYYRQSQPK